MAGSSKSRKKTEKAAATAGAKNRTKEEEETQADEGSLTDHLDRAEAAVERNHASTLELHGQWRTQLLRMSYLVMVVTLHIAQTPSRACIMDIKVSVSGGLSQLFDSRDRSCMHACM